VPASKTEREEKKQKLREELRAQQPKVSSKKQKRLDKYIENKLRKDETLDLLRKLEKEKEKYDAVAELQTSKNLGKRSFKDFVNGDGPANGSGHGQKKQKPADDVSDVESEDSFEAEHKEAFDSNKERHPSPVVAPVITQGSGLAQPLALDENGLPIIQSRKGKKKKTTPVAIPVEIPWEGFDSECSDAEHTPDETLEDNDESTDSGTDDLGSDVDEESSSGDEDGSDSEEDDSETSASDTSHDSKIKPQRVNEAYGHVPSYTEGEGQLPPRTLPQEKARESVPVTTTALEQNPADTVPNRKAYAVHIDRAETIRGSRSQLPILQREQEIMEAIHNNPVVIVKGDTGSGKTTQIPQFLFEAGYGSSDSPTPGMIGVTQPRKEIEGSV
jgi:ATP-dependent RNA helicase DHX37/DHR1